MGEEGVSFASPPPPSSLRAPNASRLLSPTAFPLGSNDDQLERAQVRAARAASIRRKSLALAAGAHRSGESIAKAADVLDHNQVMDLFRNCIKLASENKINQKNTWELCLIDHLSEIIRSDAQDDAETNFQKASCTLEAGVKIYSLRVDSVHSEAYKVLGGINRAGRGEEQDESLCNGEDKESLLGEETVRRKDNEKKKMSPVSTLESSFEALNVKKFDVAFTVDPLYHQTTAQFDEGGAKGLLLYNLGVYGGCRVLFDSFEKPENCMAYRVLTNESDAIDLSFAKEPLEKMIANMPFCADISPTLRDILLQLDDENHRPPEATSLEEPTSLEEMMVADGSTLESDHMDFDANSFADCGGPWNGDNDEDHRSTVDDNSSTSYAKYTSYQEADSECTFNNPSVVGQFDTVVDFLIIGLGNSSKMNAWAGPDHWKYRKMKDTVLPPTSSDEQEMVRKKSKKKKALPDIDFTKALDCTMPTDIFAPPKNPKSLLLPSNRTSCNNKLPEDCHYRPDSLVKLFLIPDQVCLGKKEKRTEDRTREDNLDAFQSEPLDSGSYCDDHFDGGTSYDDEDGPGSLVQKPRQVNKIEIQYDKVSKQVDVHALKDKIWNHITCTVDDIDNTEKQAAVHFSEVMHQFPAEIPDKSSAPEISPHLFFICLLHLANEHSLSLRDRPTLDEIDILIPSSAL